MTSGDFPNGIHWELDYDSTSNGWTLIFTNSGTDENSAKYFHQIFNYINQIDFSQSKNWQAPHTKDGYDEYDGWNNTGTDTTDKVGGDRSLVFNNVSTITYTPTVYGSSNTYSTYWSGSADVWAHNAMTARYFKFYAKSDSNQKITKIRIYGHHSDYNMNDPNYSYQEYSEYEVDFDLTSNWQEFVLDFDTFPPEKITTYISIDNGNTWILKVFESVDESWTHQWFNKIEFVVDGSGTVKIDKVRFTHERKVEQILPHIYNLDGIRVILGSGAWIITQSLILVRAMKQYGNYSPFQVSGNSSYVRFGIKSNRGGKEIGLHGPIIILYGFGTQQYYLPFIYIGAEVQKIYNLLFNTIPPRERGQTFSGRVSVGNGDMEIRNVVALNGTERAQFNIQTPASLVLDGFVGISDYEANLWFEHVIDTGNLTISDVKTYDTSYAVETGCFLGTIENIQGDYFTSRFYRLYYPPIQTELVNVRSSRLDNGYLQNNTWMMLQNWGSNYSYALKSDYRIWTDITFKVKDENGNPITPDRVEIYYEEDGKSFMAKGLVETLTPNSDTFTHRFKYFTGGFYAGDLKDRTLTANANAGTNQLTLNDASGLAVGDQISINDGMLNGQMNLINRWDVKKITAINGNTITLDSNLSNNYSKDWAIVRKLPAKFVSEFYQKYKIIFHKNGYKPTMVYIEPYPKKSIDVVLNKKKPILTTDGRVKIFVDEKGRFFV